MKHAFKLLILLISITFSITSYGDAKVYNDLAREQKLQELWIEILLVTKFNIEKSLI